MERQWVDVKAASGKDYPALYVTGSYNNQQGIFCSDDMGKTWVGINDDQHQYGNRFRCITGDPRIYGRVYVGTDGRGIVYGDCTSYRKLSTADLQNELRRMVWE